MKIVLVCIILCCFYKIKLCNYYYNELKKYNEEIEKDLLECRKRIHEHKNELIIMEEMFKKDINAHEYMQSLIDDKYDVIDNWLGNINSPVIKGFLRNKIGVLKELDCAIEVYVEANLTANKVRIEDEKDLYVILGVLLDNMIDACKSCDSKLASIVITRDGDYIKSSFANSYDDVIDVNKVWEDNYSSKGTGRGLGLSYVKDILKRNKKFSIDTELVDDFFVQNVYIDFN